MSHQEEYISLEDALFPEDKSKCYHVALTSFLLKRKNYCIMQCANCKKYIKYSCKIKGKGYEPCAVGATLMNKKTGECITVLPCDAIEMTKSGEWE
jgi:hypothetical protein